MATNLELHKIVLKDKCLKFKKAIQVCAVSLKTVLVNICTLELKSTLLPHNLTTSHLTPNFRQYASRGCLRSIATSCLFRNHFHFITTFNLARKPARWYANKPIAWWVCTLVTILGLVLDLLISSDLLHLTVSYLSCHGLRLTSRLDALCRILTITVTVADGSTILEQS